MGTSVLDTALSPSEIQVQLNVSAYVSLVAFTLLYFDFFSLTFESEVSRYWGTRITFASFFFYLNRYAAFLGVVPIMVQYFWTGGSSVKSEVCCILIISFSCLIAIQYCPGLQIHHQVVIIGVQIIVGIILIMRTYALYGGSRRLLAFMSCSAVGIFGFSAWSMISAERLRQPRADYPSIGCGFSLSTPMAHRIGYGWIGFLAFDIMILVFTFRKACEACRRGGCARKHGLVPTLLRDGILYFLVVAVANWGNIMSYMFAGPYLRGVGSNLTTVLSTIMASRLMLSIRDPKLIASASHHNVDEDPSICDFSWSDGYEYDGRSVGLSNG
ncbi:hypothetical protein MSAN_01733100 [Mycena sanguinolenta]|uniref:DUF6533 domain-containing protein n=1 Tax=Mycena sanguinolenta TaxID=230812 RepID=A0A8H6Y038_9AGAR|nr:hypothetical protein MSAN_01733100 [Mycena sanguinolenta]